MIAETIIISFYIVFFGLIASGLIGAYKMLVTEGGVRSIKQVEYKGYVGEQLECWGPLRKKFRAIEERHNTLLAISIHYPGKLVNDYPVCKPRHKDPLPGFWSVCKINWKNARVSEGDFGDIIVEGKANGRFDLMREVCKWIDKESAR